MPPEKRLDLERIGENLQSFMEGWKGLKDLVDSCFRKHGVTEEEEKEFAAYKERLQRLYPSIENHIEKTELNWSGGGRTLTFQNPVSQILSTTPHISYLLQDSLTWGGLPKQMFDSLWGAGTNQLNVALGRVESQITSIGDLRVEDYLLVKPWVDRLARVRRVWQRFVSGPIRKATMPIRRRLTLVLESIERNPIYKALAIMSTLGGAGAVIYLIYVWLR